MRRERRDRFPRHRLQGKPLVSDPGMHHGTYVTHVPWCMSGSLTQCGGENDPGACATRNFTYLARGPCIDNDIPQFPMGDNAQQCHCSLNHCSWWRHQMETLAALLAFCAKNSSVTSDLRRHRAHCDVIVMFCSRSNKTTLYDYLTKASDAELWCFLWSGHEGTVE